MSFCFRQAAAVIIIIIRTLWFFPTATVAFIVNRKREKKKERKKERKKEIERLTERKKKMNKKRMGARENANKYSYLLKQKNRVNRCQSRLIWSLSWCRCLNRTSSAWRRSWHPWKTRLKTRWPHRKTGLPLWLSRYLSVTFSDSGLQKQLKKVNFWLWIVRLKYNTTKIRNCLFLVII